MISGIVLIIFAALAILLPAIEGYRLHAWIDKHVPQLGAMLPTDAGAALGLAIGILCVALWL